MTNRADDTQPAVRNERSENGRKSGDLMLKLGIEQNSEPADSPEGKPRASRGTKQSRKQSPEPTFEQSIQQLSQIVDQLETGELPLETSVKLFEQGMGIVKNCEQQLKQASKKVEKLLSVDTEGNPQTEPFEV